MKQLITRYSALLFVLGNLLLSTSAKSAALTNRSRPSLALLRQPTAASLTATPSSLAAFTTMVGTASPQQGVYVGEPS